MKQGIAVVAMTAFALAAQAEQTGPGGLPPIKLNGGLLARVDVSRSKDTRTATVALKLENTGPAVVQLALIGPAPVASDNAGTSYTMAAFSGAGACTNLTVGAAGACISGDEYQGWKIPVPLQAFTQIDPGTSGALTFTFNGSRESSGTLLSFASVFAYRVVADPLKDETLSDAERRRQIKTMSVGFAPFPISQMK